MSVRPPLRTGRTEIQTDGRTDKEREMVRNVVWFWMQMDRQWLPALRLRIA